VTAREILTTPLENLVPPASAQTFKLPEGVGAPKNTVSEERIRQLVADKHKARDQLQKNLLEEMILQQFRLLSDDEARRR
jgi:hypothetical protein